MSTAGPLGPSDPPRATASPDRPAHDPDRPAASGHPGHTERLWPGPLGWLLVPVAAALAAVVLLPVHPVASVVGAGVTLVAALVAAVASAPVVAVGGGELRVGRAHIPVTALGHPAALDRDGVRAALGPGSAARTFVRVRPWVRGAVHVPVTDPADPTPSWLVSSRHPDGLASAIVEAQAHSVQTS